jgi:hypothetical protein
VIVMENKSLTQITNPKMPDPYIKSMIASGTLYTGYTGFAGSVHDYLAMTDGLIGTSAAKKSDNLFNQMQGAGISWAEYEESMPSVCYTGASVFPYNFAHNPAVHYQDITTSPSACANVVPYSSFDATALPAFSLVVPNDTNNMHTGSSLRSEIAAGDTWLSQNVPAMLENGALVILTWDESTKGAGESVATIAVGPTELPGVQDSTPYTHYSLLAGLELSFGLPLLNNAQTATPLPIL